MELWKQSPKLLAMFHRMAYSGKTTRSKGLPFTCSICQQTVSDYTDTRLVQARPASLQVAMEEELSVEVCVIDNVDGTVNQQYFHRFISTIECQ